MDQLPSSGPEVTDTRADAAALDFVCPRCARPVAERFYGPCEQCRTELRAAYAGQGRDVEFEAYEPKMNVTPNAVASPD